MKNDKFSVVMYLIALVGGVFAGGIFSRGQYHKGKRDAFQECGEMLQKSIDEVEESLNREEESK